MANSPQARKRIRRNNRRAVINHSRTSRIRSFIKKVDAAIAAGDQDAARTAFREMQPELQRGVSKGLFHRNTAARKLSRLSKRIAALG